MDSPLVIVDSEKYSRIAVIGDLHGDHNALVDLLGFVDLKVDLLVFLGDYADRGAFGVETIRRVAKLHQHYPKNVVALMGNHEDFTEDGQPRFQPFTLSDEVETKLGSWNHYFKSEFKPFIDSLHLSALVPNNALLVHGGVSSKLSNIDDLQYPSPALRVDILWSDPFDGNGEHPNLSRGAGMEFGADISLAVCKALSVERIIRSHQPTLAMTKPNYSHQNRVVTVNATSVYGGLPFVFFFDAKSSKNDNYKPIQEYCTKKNPTKQDSWPTANYYGHNKPSKKNLLKRLMICNLPKVSR